jgi:thiamine pyrophosphate-dependent acetolactate synthase large subunit-like protein
VKYGIGVKHVLLDNHSLGKIGKEQLAAGFPVWHTSLRNPDWAAYAELCGATGIKAGAREQLDAAMTRLFAADGPPCCTSSRTPNSCSTLVPRRRQEKFPPGPGRCGPVSPRSTEPHE